MQATPDPIDVYVGKRLRIRRKELGLTQERLADKLSLTFQQIQKYERGTNRISASKLYRAAMVLGVGPEWFFNGLPTAPAGGAAVASPEMQSLLDSLSSHGAGAQVRLDLDLLPTARLRVAMAEFVAAVMELA
jgi:transcriptional regulator with XRE-family HTH domain